MLVITTITINPSRFSSYSSRQNNSNFSALSQIQHVFTYLSTEGLVLWMGLTLFGKRSVEVMSGSNSDFPLVNTKRMYALSSSLSLRIPLSIRLKAYSQDQQWKILDLMGISLTLLNYWETGAPFQGFIHSPGRLFIRPHGKTQEWSQHKQKAPWCCHLNSSVLPHVDSVWVFQVCEPRNPPFLVKASLIWASVM